MGIYIADQVIKLLLKSDKLKILEILILGLTLKKIVQMLEIQEWLML